MILHDAKRDCVMMAYVRRKQALTSKEGLL